MNEHRHEMYCVLDLTPRIDRGLVVFAELREDVFQLVQVNILRGYKDVTEVPTAMLHILEEKVKSGKEQVMPVFYDPYQLGEYANAFMVSGFSLFPVQRHQEMQARLWHLVRLITLVIDHTTEEVKISDQVNAG